jgi:hypothetical protein
MDTESTDSEPADEDLLRRLSSDPAAFEVFYRRHVDRVIGFAARRVTDPADAADLVMVTGTSNAVNLTDGLDGLAVGAALMALAAYVLIGDWQSKNACTTALFRGCYAVRGHRVEVEPMTGNVLLGYARLNVPDGLWGLYNQPWDRAHFTEPALTAVERDVEVSQAEVTDGVLRTRLRRLPGLPGEGTVTISRVAGRGRWAVEADGQVMAKIQNNSAERGHEPPTLTVHVVGEEVILRCDEQPRVFTLRPEP